MSDIEVYADSGGWPVLFKLDVLTLIRLVEQTAASLIAACKDYPYDGRLPEQSPIGKVLVGRMEGWDKTNFTNTLLSQAELLHAFVKHAVECRRPPLPVMSRDTAQLVADALARFQEWKTNLCRAEQEEYGEHWGTGTGFNKANWTDRNKKFLALWK